MHSASFAHCKKQSQAECNIAGWSAVKLSMLLHVSDIGEDEPDKQSGCATTHTLYRAHVHVQLWQLSPGIHLHIPTWYRMSCILVHAQQKEP